MGNRKLHKSLFLGVDITLSIVTNLMQIRKSQLVTVTVYRVLDMI